jgi:galactoside O-acetyltransferase
MNNPFTVGYYESDELKTMGFKAIGANVRIAKNVVIIGLENIEIASNVRIDAFCVLSAFSGEIKIGNYVHVGCHSFINGNGGVTLGDFSGLSQGCRLYSTSDDYSGDYLTNPTVPSEFLNIKSAPITIEAHVILGSGTTVFPGVKIGLGSATGAMSLVNRSLPEWGIYGGIPAQFIKDRSQKVLSLADELPNIMQKI